MGTTLRNRYVLWIPILVGLPIITFSLGFRLGKASATGSSTTSSDRDEKPNGSRPESPEPPPRKSPPSRPVTLLGLLGEELKPASGRWWREENVIVGAARKDQAISLALPYVPPEEYDLNLTVERTEGEESIHLGLVTRDRQFIIVLDGLDKEGFKSGIECLDNEGFRTNSTTVARKVFENHQPRSLKCQVRRNGVSVLLDGTALLRWTGNTDRLNVGSFFKSPDRNTLFLGGWGCTVRFSDVILVPLSGEGRILK